MRQAAVFCRWNAFGYPYNKLIGGAKSNGAAASFALRLYEAASVPDAVRAMSDFFTILSERARFAHTCFPFFINYLLIIKYLEYSAAGWHGICFCIGVAVSTVQPN